MSLCTTDEAGTVPSVKERTSGDQVCVHVDTDVE